MSQLSTKLPLDLMQTKWASSLNPILALPILAGNLIENIVLTATTAKAINHLLDRNPRGWFIIDNTASVIIWRPKAFNRYTIILEASGDTTISIWVF